MSRTSVQHFRPSLEALETRELLASSLTASVYGNVLQIRDSRAGDTIRVHQLNGQISVDGISIATNNGMKPNISASAVSRIEISTPAGHDQVWLGDVGHVLNLPVMLTEGAVDTLYTPTDTKGAALPANATTMLKTPSGTLYALARGTVFESATGITWQAVSGLSSVNQLAVDGSGQVYALLSNNTLYSITGTHATSVAKGVTAMAVDSAGEMVLHQGSRGYFYIAGGRALFPWRNRGQWSNTAVRHRPTG